MAKYLITYHGSKLPNDPAVLERAKMAFGQWLQEAGDAVIDAGAPIHMVRQVSTGSPAAAVEIGGYSIVEAASLDAVVSLLNTHPFVERGGTLQINEIIS